uniref:Histidine--tRNA ligase, chloroplastic n=1 Tax=Grateloupia turuturu TaxID=118375 RepID=A0A6B9P3X1_9FLOR|nr:histidine tRNA ligase [Grateloupia turuturu]QHD45248.1 histidine--tRNA ligase [Grateloupia turuturu]UXC96792.1 histidine tRNA ligase [Grateloupia turuturu]
MQPLRGTRDILPNDVILWQHIYNRTKEILALSNYSEIRTPILESTSLFNRSIGNETDIVNKEMYSFADQGKRQITLRPEGTASVVRSFVSNKLYQESKTNRLWYLGPMFRYERPQQGRQRQFHQLGIECIGSINPMADTEVIRLATQLLQEFQCFNYKIEINSIGNLQERNLYKESLITYLISYKEDLDNDSQARLKTNPLRILDSKNKKTQEILNQAPSLNQYLGFESRNHFDLVCQYLNELNIEYNINDKLVRGLDYYNYTAFEMKVDELGSQDTICGGGRYDNLIKQLGGPHTPAVGWAIGIERLLSIVKHNLQIKTKNPTIYIITQGIEAQRKIWNIIKTLEKYKINFELDLYNNNLQKQMKRAYRSKASVCLILGDDEINQKEITLKYLNTREQKRIFNTNLPQELEAMLKNN